MSYFIIEFSKLDIKTNKKVNFKIKAVSLKNKIIRRNFNTIYLSKCKFTSYILSERLQNCNYIYPYLLVMEEINTDLQLKTKALYFAEQELGKLLCKKHQENMLQHINPGLVHDWKISDLDEFDKLLSDFYKELKVDYNAKKFRFSPEFISVGIMFSSDQVFSNCHYCKQPNCSYNREKECISF